MAVGPLQSRIPLLLLVYLLFVHYVLSSSSTVTSTSTVTTTRTEANVATTSASASHDAAKTAPSPLPLNNKKGLPTRVVGYGSRRAYESGEGNVHARLVLCDRTLQSLSTNQTVLLQTNMESLSEDDKSTKKYLEGIFGVYKLPFGRLYVWVAESDLVYEANFSNHTWKIRKVTQLYLSFVPTSSQTTTRAQRQEQKRQVALLRQALKHHEWYFCCGSLMPDMTCNLQESLTRAATAAASPKMADMDQASWRWSNATHQPDARFFWNQVPFMTLLDDHDDMDEEDEKAARQALFSENLLVLTSAFVGVQTNLTVSPTTTSASHSSLSHYDQLLITRRSRFRAGTRFTKRGADHTGNVANYAETEQLVFFYNDAHQLQQLCSHVQTRGSIPLRWSSPTDIKTYRPRVRIGTDPLAQARAMRNHLVDQARRYIVSTSTTDCRKHPALVFVNLVDKKSDQGRLGKAFDSVLNAILDVYGQNATDHSIEPSSIRHVWYDFHAEVKHGRWERLSHLLEQVEGSLAEHGYFCATPSHEDNSTAPFHIDRLQTGVVRTNCMDCLDRTNVVQGMFGRHALFRQVSDAKAFKVPVAMKTAFRKNPLSLPWSNGEVAHRLLWADNADAISRLYAGTPALKGDFTRTGKRTKRGALDDGMNSLQRYYLNNFLDADRQEGVDLLVGLQPFGLANAEESGNPISDVTSLSRRGMSIREAARRALLGQNLPMEFDDDEDSYERIKLQSRLERMLLEKQVQNQSDDNDHESQGFLDLRWLPGDLQSQVRSFAASSLQDLPSFIKSKDYLQAMDERSVSDLPWWACQYDSSSDDGDSSPEQASEVANVEVAAINNAGYLLGALLVGAQSPRAMALAVIAIVGSSFTQ